MRSMRRSARISSAVPSISPKTRTMPTCLMPTSATRLKASKHAVAAQRGIVARHERCQDANGEEADDADADGERRLGIGGEIDTRHEAGIERHDQEQPTAAGAPGRRRREIAVARPQDAGEEQGRHDLQQDVEMDQRAGRVLRQE